MTYPRGTWCREGRNGLCFGQNFVGCRPVLNRTYPAGFADQMEAFWLDSGAVCLLLVATAVRIRTEEVCFGQWSMKVGNVKSAAPLMPATSYGASMLL